MKVNSKYILLALLLSLLCLMSPISAQDNITFEQSNEEVSKETLTASPETQEITTENHKSSVNDAEEILKTDSTTFLDIQNKINNASDGGTIFLDGKTYTAISPTGIEVNKNITIIGGTGIDDAAHATLDAKGLGNIFNLTAKNIIIKGINFINSNDRAITGEDIDNLIMTDCNFINNYAESGGAVYLENISNLSISHAVFNNNRALSEGGAMYFSCNNASLENLSFSGNHVVKKSNYGSTVLGVVQEDAVVVKFNFKDNEANSAGAMGIICFGAKLSIKDSTFTNNRARNLGGALLFMGENVTVDNCTFEGNTALECGALGGHGYNASVTNSRFINNHANQSAGALFFDVGNGVISGNEFRGNSANFGGAIYTHGAGVNITDNSFVNNTAHTAGSVIWIDGAGTSFLNNNVDNPNNAFYVTNSTDLIYNNADPAQMQQVTIIIEIQNLVGLVNGHLQVQVRVHDSRGNPLFGEVGGYVYEYPYSAYDDKQLVNGEAILNLEMPDGPGIFDLTVDWRRGAGIFDDLTREVQILAINLTQLDNDSVNVTLPENSNGTVVFDFRGKTYTGVLVNNSAVVEFTNLPNGDYLPEFKYSTFEGSVPVKIQNSQKEVAITADDVTVKVNDIIKIPVSVRDSDGNPVGGAILYCNSSSINYTSTGVSTNGVFEFIIPAQNSPKTFDAIISFGNVSKTVKITVIGNAAPVYKISSNKDVSVIYSGKATYRVLVTKDGKPAAGVSVTFTFNGKKTVVKTDSNGYATLKLNTKAKVKTYTIKATYNGVSVTNKVKIKQVIKASNKKVKKSKKVTKIKVSLKKVNGKYLKKKTLKIKFNKKTYNVKTNKKGVATWKVKKSMLKKLKVGKKVKYTVTYGKAVLTKKLTIRK